MPKGDGRTCQTEFTKAVGYLGISSRVHRVVDAAKAKSLRVGQAHGDFEFKHKIYGSTVECKETSADKFKFDAILPHQMAHAKRNTEGGMHYIFCILNLMTMDMYLLHAVTLFEHMVTVRKSYMTWEELAGWQLQSRGDYYDLRLLVDMVQTEPCNISKLKGFLVMVR